jgi:hypothetical protein
MDKYFSDEYIAMLKKVRDISEQCRQSSLSLDQKLDLLNSATIELAQAVALLQHENVSDAMKEKTEISLKIQMVRINSMRKNIEAWIETLSAKMEEQ